MGGQQGTKTTIGLAQETVKGTYVAPTTSDQFLALTSFNWTDDFHRLEDKGVRGAPGDVFDIIDGPADSLYEMGGNVHAETIMRVVKGFLGELATTGASAPYQHKGTLLNSGDTQPVAYSVTDFNGNNARGFPGMQFTELGFKWAKDALFEFTAKAVGFKSAVQATPAATYNAQPPQPSWAATLNIAGAGTRVQAEAFDIQMTRKGTPRHNLGGAQDPRDIWVGPIIAPVGKITLMYDDDVDLTRYLTNAKPSLVLTLTQGAGAAVRGVTVTLSKVGFKMAKIVRGQDWVQVELDYKALMNTTDIGASGGYGPVQILGQSAITAYAT